MSESELRFYLVPTSWDPFFRWTMLTILGIAFVASALLAVLWAVDENSGASVQSLIDAVIAAAGIVFLLAPSTKHPSVELGSKGLRIRVCALPAFVLNYKDMIPPVSNAFEARWSDIFFRPSVAIQLRKRSWLFWKRVPFRIAGDELARFVSELNQRIAAAHRTNEIRQQDHGLSVRLLGAGLLPHYLPKFRSFAAAQRL